MNLKDRFQSIGFNLLTTLVIISAIFIVVGLKSSTTNWTLVSIGIAILVPIAIYFAYLNFVLSNQREDLNKKYEEQLREFKRTADRVLVDLDKVIIQERNQYHSNTVVTGKAAALNEISGHGHHNEETVKSTFCEVTFKLRYNNEELTFEKIIYKDETTIRMYFYMQKETIFYIDPFDSEHYHLDLDFIEE
jgi:hypothetical protein